MSSADDSEDRRPVFIPENADRPKPGRCIGGGGHAAIAVWIMPRDGKPYCKAHLLEVIRIAWWNKK